MTVASTINRNDYVGNGTTGPFGFVFRILAAADLAVIQRSAAGVETVLNYLSDYTLSSGAVGNRAGGTVTLTAALAADGSTLTIKRAVALLQPTELRNLGAYYPETIEDALDRLVMIDQTQQEQLDRSMRLPASVAPGTVSLQLPIPTPSTVLAWDALAGSLTNRVLDASTNVALPGNGRTTGSLTAYLANNAVFQVLDYGAKVDGLTNDTIAVGKALAAAAVAGGVVLFPPGECVCNIAVPGGMAKRLRLFGSGKGVTILRAAVPNKPVLQHSLTDPLQSDGFAIGQFTVKPHPSNGVGSGAAIDCAGFRGTTFDDISYIDNGAAYFETLYTLSAVRAGMTAALCYYNTISRPTVQGVSAGLKTIIKFENDGTGNAVNNANGTTIVNLYAYANNNIVTVVDALRSAATTIIDGWFESNTGAKAIILGTNTKVVGGWFEANANNDEISFATASDGTSNNCWLAGLYIAGPGTITIPAACSDNRWEQSFMPNKTIVDNGTNNIVVLGASQIGSRTDSTFKTKNTAAGGIEWREVHGATGGLYGNGTRTLLDVTNNKAREILHAAGMRRFFSGASNAPAGRFVPFDDATPTQTVVEVLDSTESVTKWGVTKQGGVITGGGTEMTKVVVYTTSLTPASVGAASVSEQTFTVTGLTTADKIVVNPPAVANGIGIVGAYVSAANTLALRFVNPTAGALTPTAGVYTLLAFRS